VTSVLRALAIETVVCPRAQMDFSNRDFCGAMLQYPDTTGNVYDYSTLVDSAHTNGVSSFLSPGQATR